MGTTTCQGRGFVGRIRVSDARPGGAASLRSHVLTPPPLHTRRQAKKQICRGEYVVGCRSVSALLQRGFYTPFASLFLPTP